MLEAKVEQSDNEEEKTLSEQIDELSPELKTILFTDILKPKY